jgi:hypothetical protein
MVGPILQRFKRSHQRVPMFGQPVSTGIVVNDAEVSELSEPGVERARVGVACVLQRAKRQRVTAEFPQHAQGPAPTEHVERHHDRPA